MSRKYYKINTSQLQLAMTIAQKYRQRLYDGEKLTYTQIVDEIYDQYKNLMKFEDIKNILRVVLKELGLFNRYFYRYLTKKAQEKGKEYVIRCDICGKRSQKLLISENGIDFYQMELAKIKKIKANYVLCWNCLTKKIFNTSVLPREFWEIVEQENTEEFKEAIGNDTQEKALI